MRAIFAALLVLAEAGAATAQTALTLQWELPPVRATTC